MGFVFFFSMRHNKSARRSLISHSDPLIYWHSLYIFLSFFTSPFAVSCRSTQHFWTFRSSAQQKTSTHVLFCFCSLQTFCYVFYRFVSRRRLIIFWTEWRSMQQPLAIVRANGLPIQRLTKKKKLQIMQTNQSIATFFPANWFTLQFRFLFFWDIFKSFLSNKEQKKIDTKEIVCVIARRASGLCMRL